ncbi:uncharacterized protein LOC122366005 [Amphibalanus amphitrite]|uniref:uncharacterized protein LOC122366005 n=1 Tax=Amphibalanus amphitrite TaxID=1232801 RepID=UPI001C91C2C4|nr:uncharacterized protein LOC122366005 [Amphibalanus amphitrite]
MVDTGAQVSTLPPASVPANSSLEPAIGPSLKAANGSSIAVHGQVRIPLELGGCQFPWTFLVADTTTAILGADFLRHHQLSIDMAAGTLSLPSGVVVATAASTHPDTPAGIRGLQLTTTLEYLWSEFPDVTTPPAGPAKVVHNTTHHIETTGPPQVSRPRRLAPDKLKAAKGEMAMLLDSGTFRPSKSSWASPIHLEPKGQP